MSVQQPKGFQQQETDSLLCFTVAILLSFCHCLPSHFRLQRPGILLLLLSLLCYSTKILEYESGQHGSFLRHYSSLHQGQRQHQKHHHSDDHRHNPQIKPCKPTLMRIADCYTLSQLSGQVHLTTHTCSVSAVLAAVRQRSACSEIFTKNRTILSFSKVYHEKI